MQQHTTELPSEGHRGIDRYSIALIVGATSFAELVTEYRRISATRPGRSFITLDDLGQCRYTSGHAVNRHELDDGISYPDDDSPPALEKYEAQVFEAAQRVLADPQRTVDTNELASSHPTTASHIDALLVLNRNPDLLLDDVHVVQNVPSNDVSAVLANIPNGYFEGDWTPFECLAVTRLLAERHGYEPLGVGASTLAFLSTLDRTQRRDIAALMKDLQQIYGHETAQSWNELAQVISASPLLILGYTEDFADLTGSDES